MTRGNEPNWGLGFGSGAFLLVWCLGFLKNIPMDVLVLRATVGAIAGSLVGMLVGQTVSGLLAMRNSLERADQARTTGTVVDYTVAGGPEELSATVPAARGAEDEGGFKPTDFKAAAKAVKQMENQGK